MKGLILGVMGVGAAGTVYVSTSGTATPNDFIGVVHKSPAQVYAAFSSMAPEGVQSVPSPDGWGSRFVQRIVKVPNEQVKMELLIDDRRILLAEIQLQPAEGNATQVAAEFDFDLALLSQIAREHGAGDDALPILSVPEGLIDHTFAMVMREMVADIEAGRPLKSLADTGSRWGSGGRERPASDAMRARAEWQQRASVQPQSDARPAVDPNEAARTHVSAQSQQSGGWGR